MKEVWEEIPGFPNYMVSTYGQVYNIKLKNPVNPSPNQQGILKVNLRDRGYAHTRSIASLVAETFLPREKPFFDTVIHLDGNRDNVRLDNLMWRPRWFAIKYHKQFDKPNFKHFGNHIALIETGEIFDNIRIPVMKYGLLHMDIIIGAINGTPVFPHWWTFALEN